MSILNQYLERATTIIQGQGGGVDKYMGDAVLGFFLPIDLVKEDAADRATLVDAALEAAIKLVEDAELNALFSNFRSGYSDLTGENFGIGVGIACGQAKFGVIGASWRTEYTLIGRPVNLVARIQGCAKAGEVVCTRESWNHLAATAHGFETRPLTLEQAEEASRLKGFESVAVTRVVRKPS